jgi:hypothetical protein
MDRSLAVKLCAEVTLPASSRAAMKMSGLQNLLVIDALVIEVLMVVS